MNQGIIVRGIGSFYTVRTVEGEEFITRAKKKFRRLRLTPMVGDNVMFSMGEVGEEQGWLEEILPRDNQCLRPPVANVTLLAIVIAPHPAPDYLLVDKLLMAAHRQRIRAVLVVNKCDMDAGQAVQTFVQSDYQGADVAVLPVSAQNGEGLDALQGQMIGQRTCFLGQSGVGKSTLINTLFSLGLQTGEISPKILRGKNTTRHCELFFLNGLAVFDTPGFSLLELEDLFDPVLLMDDYPEFEPYRGQCRFSPCYHDSEPGCAVKAAVQDGRIAKERMKRYQLLLAQYRQAWKERYD